MAEIRQGYLDDYTQNTSGNIGIGTTGTATNTVQVLGETKASNAIVSGISSLVTYQGFIDDHTEFGNSNIDINSQSGTLGNIEICHGDFNVSSASTLASSVNELTVTNSFSVPTGNTDSRIHCHTAGSMRFNEDLGTLEFYTGDQWRTVNSFADNGNRGRGIFGGFGPSPTSQAIYSINIHSASNAVNFGDLFTTHVSRIKALSSSTRGVFGTGAPSASPFAILDYITIASEGNGIEFGNLTQSGISVFSGCMLSSSTRGIIQEATNPTTNVISFIEIATVGNAVDFGDMKQGVRHGASFASPTRGVICGGYRNPQGANYTEFQRITIASKGN